MADATDPFGGLTGTDRDAAVAINNLFSSYGIGSLAPQIISFLKQGYSSDTISVLLQQTDAYKQRFAANDARLKAGLPVLSPAEYLATERSYRQIMQAAGVPAGFYDQPEDFQKFLEQDVSPQEVSQRVAAATDLVNRADPAEKAFFQKYYSHGDMIAYALDPSRAEPLIGKAFQAAEIGGQAARQGVGIDKSQAEQLAGAGVNAGQAQQGFSLIAQEQPNANKLAAIAGDSGFTTQDLINETFNSDAAVSQKRAKLASQERGRFGGSSGTTGASLATDAGGQL